MHPVLFIYEFPQGDFPKLQHGDNAISCRHGSTRTFLDCSVPYFPVISCISIVEFDRSGRIQNARGRRDRGGHHASNPPPRSHASSPLPPGDRQLQSHGKRGDCEWSSTFREPGAFIDLYTNWIVFRSIDRMLVQWQGSLWLLFRPYYDEACREGLKVKWQPCSEGSLEVERGPWHMLHGYGPFFWTEKYATGNFTKL